MTRPSEAIFADGKRRQPLALHPEAIGVSFPTKPTEEIRRAKVVRGIAVLSVNGPLMHKGDDWWSYWQTYEDLARDFASLLQDVQVRAVVLKFDSPGGECAGLNETVAIMQGMKKAAGKPVVAYVDEACYSAAYALAMVADEIYLPESGGVGSVGVITAMTDLTAMLKKDGVRVEVIASGSKKTDGHPCVPLTDGAIKRTRQGVDKLATAFFELVAAGRGLPVATVAGFQAGTFTGQAAVDVGLADGVMSLQECLTIATKEFSSPKEPTYRSAEKDASPMKLAATKALNDAHKAMAAATTAAEQALCAARILAAEQHLSKVKKTKTVTTDTHEEEIDDGEPDEDEDEDEDVDEEAESEDSDAEASAAPSAPLTKSGKADAVLAFAREITGKQSVPEVLAAMRGMHESYKRTSKLAAKVARLEADAKTSKLSALIAKGQKARKLTPALASWARTQTPEALQAYLDAAEPLVAGIEDAHTEATVEGAKHGTVSAEMAKIWKRQGFSEKDYPNLLAKLNGGSTANGAS